MRRRTRPKNTSSSQSGYSFPSTKARSASDRIKQPYVIKECNSCGNKYLLGPLDPNIETCPVCFASGIGLVRTSEPPEVKSSQKPRWYLTGKSDALVSTRNRKILSLLNLEGASTTDELSKRMHLTPNTTEVELRYLEQKGLVKKV